MQFSLKQLRYALAAADSGNVTEAAAQLNISQPSVSGAIAHLEGHYGRPLFVRHTGQGVTLTTFGRSVMQQARSLLNDAADLADLDRQAGDLSGEIAIACFEDLAPFYLAALLRAFGEQHPGVRVSFREDGFDGLARAVREGAVDLALTYDLGLDVESERYTLLALRPHAILPNDHPLLDLDRLTLRALSRYPLILTDQAQSWQFILGLFQARGLEPQVALRAGSFEMQRSLVAQGFGVALSYTRPVATQSYDGTEIQRRPVLDRIAAQRILLAHDRRFPLRATAAAFRDFAVTWFGTQQDAAG